MKRAKFAKQKVEIFKPALDTRYSEEDVVSHDQNSIRSTPIESSGSILLLASDIDVVGIDEAQFLDNGLVEVCNELANRGVRVIVAGLDMDFKGVPFGPIPALCAIADEVTKVHAICVKCGSVAYVSHRLINNDKRVLLGEKDEYEPLCRECYQKAILNENYNKGTVMGKEITFDKFIRWAGVTLIVLAVLYMTNYLSSVLLPFFIAWFFAYLLYPVVKFIENKLHIRIRALSILLAMGTAIAVIGGVLWLIIPPMIDQFDKLGEVLTRWLHQTTHTNNLTALIKDWLQANQEQIELFLKSKDFSDAIKTTMPKVFSVVSQTATVLMSIVASMITLLYMFFILLDYETLTANWVRIFPKKNRPFWSALMKDVERELNNYIRGQGLVALCMGIMFCIGFTIIGFPMAIGMGILIGIMDLVPYLHTFALIPTAFLAMLKAADTGQNFWLVFGLAVLVFCVVQVITDMVVTPKIMGKAMGLNPAILLLSLSVWGSLLGFLGLIVALPLTTLIIAYWQRYVTKEKPQYHEETGENVPISDKNEENQ